MLKPELRQQRIRTIMMAGVDERTEPNFMKIRMGTMVLTGTVLLLQCIHAGQAGAYDPNEDPNVVQRRAERSSWRSAQVVSLVGEFERLQPGSSSPSRDRPLSAAAQPALYARSDSQPAAAQPFPYEVGADPYYFSDDYSRWSPVDQFFWNGHHHRWAPARLHSSPRIPWWSLLRFTKH
jgi:hypothetical protein